MSVSVSPLVEADSKKMAGYRTTIKRETHRRQTGRQLHRTTERAMSHEDPVVIHFCLRETQNPEEFETLRGRRSQAERSLKDAREQVENPIDPRVLPPDRNEEELSNAFQRDRERMEGRFYDPVSQL